jgi:large subunit ribosomal protein L18
MILNLEKTARKRLKRRKSIRKRVVGTPERPRLTVYRSLHHTYAQIIDDSSGQTLVTASTVDKELREQVKGLKKAQAAEKVGELLAERCAGKQITQVVFDRNGYAFKGRVAQVATAARKKGLSF